jgi:hypothetical protein
MNENGKFIPLYKKATLLFLVLFIWSSIGIALDQHDDAYSGVCPICHAKSSINGAENTFVLDAHLVSAYYCLTDKLFDVTIPIALSRQGRAPPELFQS